MHDLLGLFRRIPAEVREALRRAAQAGGDAVGAYAAAVRDGSFGEGALL